MLASAAPPVDLGVAGALGVAALLVAVVAAVVLAVADLVPLDALEVGEYVGADLGPVGAQRVVVLVASVAAVVFSIAKQQLRNAHLPKSGYTFELGAKTR